MADSEEMYGEQLEAVDCFKYLGSQVAANEGCERDVVHRMNEGYRAWGALKSVLRNRGLDIKAKKCLYFGPCGLVGLEFSQRLTLCVS